MHRRTVATFQRTRCSVVSLPPWIFPWPQPWPSSQPGCSLCCASAVLLVQVLLLWKDLQVSESMFLLTWKHVLVRGDLLELHQDIQRQHSRFLNPAGARRLRAAGRASHECVLVGIRRGRPGSRAPPTAPGTRSPCPGWPCRSSRSWLGRGSSRGR